MEFRSGSVTNTKQFVLTKSGLSETRDASSSLSAQYFAWGQTLGAVAYYKTTDHLGSVRELTDSSGSLQAQFDYDPFGKISQLHGSTTFDFQYAGYFFHAPSGLCLTQSRAYSSSFGRFMNRDSISALEQQVSILQNLRSTTVNPNGAKLELLDQQVSIFQNPNSTVINPNGSKLELNAKLFFGNNLYAYVNNDPILYIDPLGLSPCKPTHLMDDRVPCSYCIKLLAVCLATCLAVGWWHPVIGGVCIGICSALAFRCVQNCRPDDP